MTGDELYDANADPAMVHNLAELSGFEETVGELKIAIDELLNDRPNSTVPNSEYSQQEIEALKSLGYMQ